MNKGISNTVFWKST